MKDVILILGAGNAQIDAIKYCQSKGYEVCGCSYTTVDNGIPYLDYFEHVDIKSVEGVIETARKYNAKAVYSIGSDIAMPTVMRACEALGLQHFISASTAENCHSKSRMRSALGTDFRGNLPYIECASLEEALAFNSFPAMMKPTDSQGQRGCFRVDSVEDIRKEFQTSMDFSHEKRVILEKFVSGAEVSVNGYMHDGKLKFALVSDRISFDEYPGGIIKEHVVPSSIDKAVQENTVRMVEEACVRIGLNNGPCYFQIKYDDMVPYVIEVTPRLDGCHMWNLIKHYCGVDLLDATFTHLLEGAPALPEYVEFHEEEHRLIFLNQAPWTKFNSSNFDCSDAEYYIYYYKDGDKVRRLNGYIEKCGYKIVKINH